MFKAKQDGGRDIGAGEITMLLDGDLRKFTEVNRFFVDASGWGQEGEPALTTDQFLKKVKAGKYYAIIEASQFQVHVGEYTLAKGNSDG